MFGQNPVRHSQAGRSDGLLRVQEVFYTIQGEGPFSGHPAVFVRMAGCNLRCWFCDTDFESKYETGLIDWQQLAEQVIKETRGLTRLVVVTGGEPLLQRIDLLARALPWEFHVQVETAATVNPFPPGVLKLLIPERLSFIISPKTPRLDPVIQQHVLAYKYLVRTRDKIDEVDGLPWSSTQQAQGQGPPQKLARPPDGFPHSRIYLQPVDEPGDAKLTGLNADWAAKLCLRYGYTLSLQVHKLVGLP